MADRSGKQGKQASRGKQGSPGKQTSRKAQATGSRRSTPVKVDKPFPWGVVVTSVVLAALLIGIIVYAVANQGSGVRDLLAEDDQSIEGVQVFDDLSRDHVEGDVEYPDYPSRPPAGGEHSAVPQQCDVYQAPISPENAVHSLEHGAVWVTYSPDLPQDQVEVLTEAIEGDPYQMLSPLPGQESPIVLTAWGRQLAVDEAGDPRVEEFLDTYTNGRQTPEKGAACAGTTATEGQPAVDGEPMPQPTG